MPRMPGHETDEHRLLQEHLRAAGNKGLPLGLVEAIEHEFAALIVDEDVDRTTPPSPEERRKAGI